MEKTEIDKALKSSVRTHIMIAFSVILFMLGGMVAWATMTEISGAVVASGTVVVEGNIKQVQHQEGGIVQNVHVKNGDIINAGDLLIDLDDTVSRANLAVVTKQLDSLYAQEARLTAEQDGLDIIKFSDEQFDDDGRTASVEVIKDSQQRLFEARRNSLNGQKQQLGEQIVQFEKQIEGYEAQRHAKVTETKFIAKELEDLDGLLTQKLISASRVSLLNREKAQLEGELGGFTAQIAQTKEAISERNIQILQLDEDFLASVLQQLQDARGQVAQLEEQRIAAQDQLTRIEIRAPRSGLVHNLNVHTIGQVIASGDVTMLIVPQDDQLIIEAQVQPINIDQISANQQATIRLPSFDQRTTPELRANVKTISADLLQDQITGLSFYQVRLTIPGDELSKLGDKTLVPGMPVEAFIKTQDRTVASYLTKPITDQIMHAMRER